MIRTINYVAFLVMVIAVIATGVRYASNSPDELNIYLDGFISAVLLLLTAVNAARTGGIK